MHRQRHRRASGKCFAGRDRHGAAHPPRRAGPGHRHQERGDLEHLAAALAHHRHRSAAQQGHRGQERLQPRVRDSSGRRTQGAFHLRDHDPRERGAHQPPHGAGKTLRQARPAGAAAPLRLRADRGRTRPRLRGVQEARRQEEGSAGRRLGGADHRPRRSGRRRRRLAIGGLPSVRRFPDRAGRHRHAATRRPGPGGGPGAGRRTSGRGAGRHPRPHRPSGGD